MTVDPGSIGTLALVVCGGCILLVVGGLLIQILGAGLGIIGAVLDLVASLIGAGPLGWLGCLIGLVACAGTALLGIVLYNAVIMGR